MEDLVKVVVFEVDVPEDITKYSSIHSKPFTIEIDNCTKSTWKIVCTFNHEQTSFVGVFIQCTSTLVEPLSVIHSYHLISINKSTEVVGKSYVGVFTSVSRSHWGPQKFISLKQLQDNSKDLFISGRKIRIVAKIFCAGVISPSKVATSTVCLKKLYETMSHSDLIIESSSGEEFKAHKNIVCARSEVLSRMFSNQMKENLSGVFKIIDRSEVVKELIRFIYCGDFADDFEEIEDVDIDLYNAAERYQLENLKAVCLKSIYKRLEVNNALKFVGFSKLFNLTKLYSCCLFMMFANFSVVSQSDDWKSKSLEDKFTISDGIMQKSHKLLGNEVWTSDAFQ